MTRINPPAAVTPSKEPPPSSVWAMTMAVLGAAFGAASSPTANGGWAARSRRTAR